MDGEESATERETLDAHLATCAPCRRFSDEAARVTRLARTAVAVPEPDVVRAVLASAPPYRRPRLSAALRVLLGLVGLAQAEVALAEILGAHAGGAGSQGVVLQGASVAHFAHESAAWNFALGVGFLWVAWRSSRTSGMVPTLATFVTVLTVLVVMDVMAGGVDVARLAIHGLVVLGLILVIALDRCRDLWDLWEGGFLVWPPSGGAGRIRPGRPIVRSEPGLKALHRIYGRASSTEPPPRSAEAPDSVRVLRRLPAVFSFGRVHRRAGIRPCACW